MEKEREQYFKDLEDVLQNLEKEVQREENRNAKVNVYNQIRAGAKVKSFTYILYTIDEIFQHYVTFLFQVDQNSKR